MAETTPQWKFIKEPPKRNIGGLHGNLYQIKLFMFFAMRGLKKNYYKFEIATELEEAGKFDDVVFQYEEQGKIVYRLLQAKHTQKIGEKITIDDLFFQPKQKQDKKSKVTTKENNDTIVRSNKKDNFSLSKYFASYCEIKKEIMFHESELKDLIIFTNMGLDVDNIKQSGIEIEELTDYDPILSFEKLHQEAKRYKFKSNEKLKKIIIDNFGKEDKKKKVVVETENIMEINNGKVVDEFLDKLIFAVYQPNQHQLENIMKEDLKSLSNRINNDLNISELLNTFLYWSMEQQGVFLSNEQIKQFFDELKENLYKYELPCLTAEFLKQIKESQIVFKVIPKELNDFFQSPEQKIFNLISSSTKLGSAVVYQALENINFYQEIDSFLFIPSSTLLHLKEKIMTAFNSENSYNLLVVECSSEEKSSHLMNELFDEVVKVKRNKKIILITREKNYLVTNQKNIVRSEYYEEIILDSNFSDLKEESQNKLLLGCKVTFQGNETSLHKLIPKNYKTIIDKETFQKLVNNEEIKIGYKLLDIAKYYMPRRFDVEIEIKTVILDNKNISDLFVISGDNTKFEELRIEFGANRSIHWLKKRHGRLFWQQSHGTMINLIKYRVFHEDSQKTHTYLTEDELLNKKEKIIIISDLPGTGKSTVFSSLAIKMKTKHRNLWVIRVDLTYYTKFLQKQIKQTKINPIEFLLNILQSSKDQSKLNSKFELDLFKNSFNNEKNRIVLFFDGFDEISPDYTELVIDLLKELKKLQLKKLFVTTRPNMRQYLEEKLETFSYSFEPFNKNQQINFLIKYWNGDGTLKSENIRNEDILRKDATYLIEMISREIGDSDNVFLSNPLQLRMIAKIFKNNKEFETGQKVFSFYTDDGNNKTFPIFYGKLNLTDLYEHFIQITFYDLYLEEKKKFDLSQTGLTTLFSKAYQDFLEECQILALAALFEDNIFNDNKLIITTEQKCKMDELISEIQNGLKNEGIITGEIIDGKPSFVHRTFAEYFVAKFFISEVKKNENQAIEKFIITNILVKTEYRLICSFFDNYLKKECLMIMEDSVNNTIMPYAAEITELNVLHNVAKLRYWNIVKWLVIKGVDTSVSDAKKRSIVHCAADHFKWDIVLWLIDRKIRINSQDKYERSILLVAANSSDWNVTTLLMHKGINPNIPDRKGKNLLHYAAQRRRWEMVKFLISSKKIINVNSQDKIGRTVLHYVAESHQWEQVKWLIENTEIDANIQNIDGKNLLHYVVQSGEFDLLKYLVIDKCFDINILDKNRKNLLFYAAGAENFDILEWLVTEKQLDINAIDKNGRNLQYYAAYSGKLNIIKWLIEKNVNINSKYINDGRTILHCTADAGHWDLMLWLVENNFNKNAQDKNGKTVLHYVASQQFWSQVQDLVNLNIDANLQDYSKKTVLNYAAEHQNWIIVRWLIEKNINGNIRLSNGRNLLHYAAFSDQWEEIRWLMDKAKNIDVNAQDNDGKTILHYVISENKWIEVKWLVEWQGINLNIQDNDGKTALHYALCKKHCWEEITWLVERNGTDVNVRDNNGKYVILHAAYRGNLDLVKCLVFKKNANLNVLDNKGQNILFYAVYSSNLELIEFLINEKVNINIENKNGETLLDCAKRLNRVEVVEWLKNRRQNMESQLFGG